MELYQVIFKYGTNLVFGVNFDLFGSVYCWWFNLFLMFVSKTESVTHVSNKVLRATWPHGPCGHIMFLAKSLVYDCICNNNFEFWRPLLCFHNVTNSFSKRGLLPVCAIHQKGRTDEIDLISRQLNDSLNAFCIAEAAAEAQPVRSLERQG